MSDVDIVEVESTSQLNDFIDYPSRLYRDDPHYVIPLKSERREFFDHDKNPFFRSAKTRLFLAQRGHQTTGRIAMCINFTHNEYHEEQVGFFGFFDCEDDYQTARQLLKVAMIEIKRAGMEKMRGPMNFSTNHECGFLIEGFDSPPSVMMTYNKPYLPRLAEKFGLKKAMDLVAYKLDATKPIPEKFVRVVEKLKERDRITLRPLNMKRFDEEVQTVREIYNRAWQHNWGFVPLGEDEFRYVAMNLKQIVDPDIVLIAEHEGDPVGFAMSVPDVNKALIHLKGRLFPFGLFKLLWHTKIRDKIDSTRTITLGVVPEYQKRGVDSMLYVESLRRGKAKGYQSSELSWMLETNELIRAAVERLGAVMYKRYRIVEMPL